LHPIKLSLHGSFCVELFKYGQEILSHLSILFSPKVKEKINENQSIIQMDKIKSEDNVNKTIYFENLFIDQMRIEFSFTSVPGLLDQIQMNTTLKFLVAILANMKNLNLDFKPFILNHKSQLLPIFFNDISNHYLSECYSEKQLFQLISSVGLLGNLQDTVTNFQTAFKSLVRNPARK
jgi:hypothetical protein